MLESSRLTGIVEPFIDLATGNASLSEVFARDDGKSMEALANRIGFVTTGDSDNLLELMKALKNRLATESVWAFHGVKINTRDDADAAAGVDADRGKETKQKNQGDCFHFGPMLEK